MSTLIPFAVKDSDGADLATLNPSGNANGVAEWSNTDSPRSQRYIVTASVRNTSGNNRRYTIRMQIPKVDTQTVNGVDLPVTAWKAYATLELTLPVFASPDDLQKVIDTYVSTLERNNPVSTAVAEGVGFY